MSASITDRAMLCSVTVSIWTGRRHDRDASTAVTKAHGATEGAGRFHKRLMPADAATFDAVRRVGQALRREFYRLTLPWLDDGTRVLPTRVFQDFGLRMEAQRDKFKNAVAAFVADYDSLRERARSELGTLFDLDDYPDNVEAKFGTAIRYFPMPSSSDFRITLTDAQMQAVQASTEAATTEAIATAMRDVWQRLHAATSTIADRLGNQDRVIRNSIVTNLREVLDVLPALNLTDDPVLAQLVADAKQKLAPHDPDRLRADPSLRRDVATEAQAIVDAMQPYMGGQNG